PLFSNGALASTGDGCVMASAQPSGPITGYKGLCLDDNAGLSTNGNPVDVWQCHGGAGQRWTFANGRLKVVGKCLTGNSWGGVGTKLVIEPCNGQRNKQWSHNASNEYVLAFKGLCLTLRGSIANGTQVQVVTCTNANDQHWSLP